MKYQALYDDIMRYIREHGITKGEFSRLCGRSGQIVSSIRNGVIGSDTLTVINRVLGTDHKYDLNRTPPHKVHVRLPDWVYEAPSAIRSIVVQEYYIDPERARQFAKCKSVDEIYALRRQRWRDEGPPKHSSAHIDNADMPNLSEK